jgi:peptidoglycan/LPS O-acetylase OafA/YrhL
MSLADDDIAPVSAKSELPAKEERVYFPELDGMRFIAFLLVYLFHEGVPPSVLAQIVGSKVANALRSNGGYGVQLFFILSGYLITTLLLREETRYGRIALRAFWIRRTLRIWPLYYLIVFIGFFVLLPAESSFRSPHFSSTVKTHFLPFLLFLGNWSMALNLPIESDALSVLWSVCVEEQFYLIVPLLIALVVPRYRLMLVGILMAGSIAVRWACASRWGSELLIVFNTFAQFDTLLSGVMLALVMGWDRERSALARWLFWLQWPIYGASIWLLSQDALGHGSVWHRTWDFVWVWMCCVGIIVVAVWGKGWLRAALSYSRIVWLGKISYGLYMYHQIVLWVRNWIIYERPWFPNQEEILAVASFALVIAMAAASYYGYERRFLVWKSAWTRVPSRPV